VDHLTTAFAAPHDTTAYHRRVQRNCRLFAEVCARPCTEHRDIPRSHSLWQLEGGRTFVVDGEKTLSRLSPNMVTRARLENA